MRRAPPSTASTSTTPSTATRSCAARSEEPMRNTIHLVTCLAGIAAGAGCGDNNDLVCEPGTYKVGASCTGQNPNDKTPPVTFVSPKGGRSRAPVAAYAVLTANEAATVFYTID